MEEDEVQEQPGGNGSWTRWALGATAAALASAVTITLASGAARAQCPGDPTYCLPTPTATPFANNAPPPQQPSSGPKLLDPFPVVRTAGSFTRNRTTFTRVTVKAPVGTRIDGRCSKKRCKRYRKTVFKTRTYRLRRLQRTYKPRTRLEIRVLSDTRIGKYVRIVTRRGKRPLRIDRCLQPGRTKPSSCGAG